MSSYDDEFDQIINGMTTVNTPTESIDQNPYGNPVQHHKTGLTKRGKAALGIGVAVIAGGGLMGYQVYSANAAESAAKAQEIALKADALQLEKLREINRANEVDRKAAANQETARQASVDACVKSMADQISKGYASHRSAVNDCQAQYPSNSTTNDMGAAASAQTAGTSNGGGGANEGLLIGGGVLAVFLVAAAKKGTRSNPA